MQQCHPIVITFLSPFQNELTNTTGPGSNTRLTFPTGKSRF
jgi:hypothetical protein